MDDGDPLDQFLGTIKGDFAESLVRNLFRFSDYEAKIYGEWKVSYHGDRIPTTVGKNRPDHPDILISKDEKEQCFLEVKFRARGHMRLKHHKKLVEQSAYWSQIHPFSVILVNCWDKPYFKLIDLSSAKITYSGVVYESSPLMDAEWKLNNEFYQKAEEIVESSRNWKK